jgi:hypothetical protein
MLPPLAAGAGAPAAFAGAGFVIDIAGVGLVAGVVDGVAGVLGLVGIEGLPALPTGVVDDEVDPLASTGDLAPPAPAMAVFVFIPVAARGGIEVEELLSALHAQRVRALIHIHADERARLLDFLIISVLQCEGRTRPIPTSSLRSAFSGALTRC